MHKAPVTHLKIAVLPGDGVGPEIMDHALTILDIVQAALPVAFDIDRIDCGGAYYLAHGREWAEDAPDLCRQADALLLGAVGHVAAGRPVMTRPGHPYPDARLAGYGPVVGTRKNLDLFANVRPIKPLAGAGPAHDRGGRAGIADYVIVRENTEDAYAEQDREIPGGRETAIRITGAATRRIARFAFELARRRDKQVTCVDKSNIIGAHALFRETVARTGREEFPDVTLEFAYADAFCLSQLQAPDRFDVVVCPNFVGDIVSDAAALLLGGLGMAPSANLGEGHAMFEPVHGSAPDIAGRDRANPVGLLLSLGMMFEWLGETRNLPWLGSLSPLLTSAVETCFKKGILTRDLSPTGGIGTRAMGEAVAEAFSGRLAQWKEKGRP